MKLAEQILRKVTCNEMREPTDERIMEAMKDISWQSWWSRANLFETANEKKERALFEVSWNQEIPEKKE